MVGKKSREDVIEEILQDTLDGMELDDLLDYVERAERVGLERLPDETLVKIYANMLDDYAIQDGCLIATTDEQS